MLISGCLSLIFSVYLTVFWWSSSPNSSVFTIVRFVYSSEVFFICWPFGVSRWICPSAVYFILQPCLPTSHQLDLVFLTSAVSSSLFTKHYCVSMDHELLAPGIHTCHLHKENFLCIWRFGNIISTILSGVLESMLCFEIIFKMQTE